MVDEAFLDASSYPCGLEHPAPIPLLPSTSSLDDPPTPDNQVPGQAAASISTSASTSRSITRSVRATRSNPEAATFSAASTEYLAPCLLRCMGGKGMAYLLVQQFLQRMQGTPKLYGYLLDGVEMSKLTAKLTDFVVLALGRYATDTGTCGLESDAVTTLVDMFRRSARKGDVPLVASLVARTLTESQVVASASMQLHAQLLLQVKLVQVLFTAQNKGTWVGLWCATESHIKSYPPGALPTPASQAILTQLQFLWPKLQLAGAKFAFPNALNIPWTRRSVPSDRTLSSSPLPRGGLDRAQTTSPLPRGGLDRTQTSSPLLRTRSNLGPPAHAQLNGAATVPPSLPSSTNTPLSPATPFDSGLAYSSSPDAGWSPAFAPRRSALPEAAPLPDRLPSLLSGVELDAGLPPSSLVGPASSAISMQTMPSGTSQASGESEAEVWDALSVSIESQEGHWRVYSAEMARQASDPLAYLSRSPPITQPHPALTRDSRNPPTSSSPPDPPTTIRNIPISGDQSITLHIHHTPHPYTPHPHTPQPDPSSSPFPRAPPRRPLVSPFSQAATTPLPSTHDTTPHHDTSSRNQELPSARIHKSHRSTSDLRSPGSSSDAQAAHPPGTTYRRVLRSSSYSGPQWPHPQQPPSQPSPRTGLHITIERQTSSPQPPHNLPIQPSPSPALRTPYNQTLTTTTTILSPLSSPPSSTTHPNSSHGQPTSRRTGIDAPILPHTTTTITTPHPAPTSSAATPNAPHHLPTTALPTPAAAPAPPATHPAIATACQTPGRTSGRTQGVLTSATPPKNAASKARMPSSRSPATTPKASIFACFRPRAPHTAAET